MTGGQREGVLGQSLSVADAKDALIEPMMALMVIAEIMVALGEDTQRDDGGLPATWVLWLGRRVSDATAEMSAVIGRIV